MEFGTEISGEINLAIDMVEKAIMANNSSIVGSDLNDRAVAECNRILLIQAHAALEGVHVR